MAIAIYLVFIFIIFVLVKAYKQKITWCFLCYMAGILFILTASLLYISKFTYYNFPFDIDYSLYLWMSKIKIRISSISRIYNIGMGLIILVPCILFHILGRKNYFRDIALFIPACFYVWYNDYSVGERIYIALNSAGTPVWFGMLVKIAGVISLLTVYAAMLLSVGCFAMQLKKAKHFQAKRENAVCIICMAAMHIFVIAFFLCGKLKYINSYYATLLKYPTSVLEGDYLLLPASLMGVIIITIGVLIYFQPFGQFVIFRKKNIYRNNKKLNKSTRMIFHTYKNSFVAIAKLAEMAENNAAEHYDIVIDILSKIKEAANTSVDNISGIIDALGEVKLSLEKISAMQCIKEARLQAALPDNIQFIEEYKCDDTEFYASKNHIVSMLANIITNAVEAINIAEIPNGRIILVLDRDEHFIYFQIKDNGPGIKHSDLKNIFKPLFSGKSGSNNFGLGLTYVENVVKAHFGYINVESKPGDGTVFQILLPIEKEEFVWKK